MGGETDRQIIYYHVFQEPHRGYKGSQEARLEGNNAVSCLWHIKTKTSPHSPSASPIHPSNTDQGWLLNTKLFIQAFSYLNSAPFCTQMLYN